MRWRRGQRDRWSRASEELVHVHSRAVRALQDDDIACLVAEHADLHRWLTRWLVASAETRKEMLAHIHEGH